MKATLKFTLPEERTEHQLAIARALWQIVAWDLDQWLRAEEKYQDRETVTVEKARDKIRELMENNNLTFDE